MNKSELKAVEGLKCAEPGCNGTLRIRWSPKLSRWFYGCDRWPDCNGVLPANPDGSPRGRPRTRKLQGARNAAHQTFDRLWKDKHCSRAGAYAWLREVTGLDEEHAHMFMMTEEQCKEVVAKVEQYGPGTDFWDGWVKRKPAKKRKGNDNGSCDSCG